MAASAARVWVHRWFNSSASAHADDHHPHPAHVPQARRTKAGGDAGRRGRGRHGRGSTMPWSRRWRGRSGGERCWTIGVHATLEDLARANGVHATYVSRILRLTLLAPEIVEAILDGRQPAELQLDDLLKAFTLDWAGQCQSWATISRSIRAVRENDIVFGSRRPRPPLDTGRQECATSDVKVRPSPAFL